MKKLLPLFTILFSVIANSQVVINEVDVANASTDTMEFVEFKSATPNYSLNGLVLVLFNGAGGTTVSYKAYDLSGITTNINGIATIGGSQVVPLPNRTMANATDNIQNGPDAIGLYTGTAANYPTGFVATTTNLVGAIFYTTGTAAANAAITSTQLSALGLTVSINENANSLANTQSIQRKNDGTYEVKVPTPGVPNDGSGTPLNYITTTTNLTTDSVTNLPTVTEGQSITFTFTTTTAVTTSPLVINFSLDNGSFNANDYSGTLSATIPVGSTTITKTVPILDDGVNEGDEEAQFTISTISSGYVVNNNNIVIRVNNINYTVLPFGTPSNPTHGLVSSTAPAGYYNSIEGLSGVALKQGLQDIIANPSIVRAHNYGDAYDIIRVADQNPANSNQVWLIYTEEGRSKLDEQSGNSIVGKYNREHIFCQSRGGFSDGTSGTADGINVWLPTSANDIMAGHADAHHIRAVDGQENSSRNDRNYGVDYNGPSGSTNNGWKGDVARALFYMGVRYNNLNIVNGNPLTTPDGFIGDLTTLLSWNTLDTADDFEMNRNNYIYTWQVNRNPFIDYPTLVDYVYGTNYGQPWHAPVMATTNFDNLKIAVYPNPAKDYVNTYGIVDDTNIEIYDMTGSKVFETNTYQDIKIPLQFASGIYMMKLSSDNKMVTKKLIVN
jgi:hypothetical protein